MATHDEAKPITTLTDTNAAAGAWCASDSISSDRLMAAASGSGPDQDGVRITGTDSKSWNLNTRVESAGSGRRSSEAESSVKAHFTGQNTGDSDILAESVEVLDSGFGVEKDYQNAAEKSAVEIGGSGISLPVEVHGPRLGNSGENGKSHRGYEADKGFDSFPKGIIMMDPNCEREYYYKEDEGGTGNDNAGEDGDEDMKGFSQKEHEYSVGDFVWGKMKISPWWPGRIYDPSDASEFASTYNQKKDRLLVAYFGDYSFSWCLSTQLKPFLENFEAMSKQSTDESFVNAVQKAANEIGRLLELKIIGSCFLKYDQIAINRPLAVNGGIKAGVLVPLVDPCKLAVPWHEPAKLLANMRDVARCVSNSSMLELTLMRSWLSAFYHAKRGYFLAIYREPRVIEGLEDKNISEPIHAVECDVPVDGPVEELWLSLPVSHGSYQAENQTCKRTKQKCVAQITKEGADYSVERGKRNLVKEGTNRGKITSKKKKRKGNNEPDWEDDDNTLLSLLEKNRSSRTNAEISEVNVTGENKTLNLENGGAEGEEIGDGKGKEQAKRKYTPRGRKKSKYLSPPYTSVEERARNSSSKRDSETESEKIGEIVQTSRGQMTKAASQAIGSPILRCNAKIIRKRQPLMFVGGGGASGSLSLQAEKQDKMKKVAGSIKINATAKEALSLVQSAALNLRYLMEEESFAVIADFVSSFRSCAWMNESDCNVYLKHQASRKRKSLDSEPRLQEEDNQLSEHRSQINGNLKKKETKSGTLKVKQGGRASASEANFKEAGCKNLPAAIIALFRPNYSLPSMESLTQIFSKFGALIEVKLDFCYKASCARIVFANTSDAEEVFKLMVKDNPLGDANVKYRLWYPSEDVSTAQKISPSLGVSPEIPVNSSDPQGGGGDSLLQFIKQKIKKITTMVGNCDGTTLPEIKSSLEEEVKCLLEMVSTMADS